MVFSPENDPAPLPPSDTERIRYLGDVQRLCLKPGDVIVLQVPGVVSQEMARHLKELMEKTMPGHRCLILESGMKIGVMGKE